MKAVDYCQREIKLSAFRDKPSESKKQTYPLNQFKPKKSWANIQKVRSNNITLISDKTKYSDAESKSITQHFPSIDARDTF